MLHCYRYDISDWSVYEASLNRQFHTNNVSEGYNSMLSSIMLNKTPDTYKMIEFLINNNVVEETHIPYSMNSLDS